MSETCLFEIEQMLLVNEHLRFCQLLPSVCLMCVDWVIWCGCFVGFFVELPVVAAVVEEELPVEVSGEWPCALGAGRGFFESSEFAGLGGPARVVSLKRACTSSEVTDKTIQ